MKVALDTNILVYAEGANGAEMRDKAVGLIQRLPASSVALPAQTLGELFHVLTRKAKRSAKVARSAILGWRDSFAVLPTSSEVIISAADLAAGHELTIWDAVVLAASAEAGCRLLLSEDLHDGFTWRGVTVTNPFAEQLHPLLAGLLIDDDTSLK